MYLIIFINFWFWKQRNEFHENSLKCKCFQYFRKRALVMRNTVTWNRILWECLVLLEVLINFKSLTFYYLFVPKIRCFTKVLQDIPEKLISTEKFYLPTKYCISTWNFVDKIYYLRSSKSTLKKSDSCLARKTKILRKFDLEIASKLYWKQLSGVTCTVKNFVVVALLSFLLNEID